MSWEKFTVAQLRQIVAENNITVAGQRKHNFIQACDEALQKEVVDLYLHKFQRRGIPSSSVSAASSQLLHKSPNVVVEMMSSEEDVADKKISLSKAGASDLEATKPRLEPTRQRASLVHDDSRSKSLVKNSILGSKEAREEFLARRLARKSLPVSEPSEGHSSKGAMPRRRHSATVLQFADAEKRTSPVPDTNKRIIPRESVYIEQSPISCTQDASPSRKEIFVPHLTVLYPNKAACDSDVDSASSAIEKRKRKRDLFIHPDSDLGRRPKRFEVNCDVIESKERSPGLAEPMEMLVDLFSGRRKLDGFSIGLSFLLVGVAVAIRSLGYISAPDPTAVAFCDSFAPAAVTPSIPCLPCPTRGFCLNGKATCGSGNSPQFSLMNGWTCDSSDLQTILAEEAVRIVDRAAGEFVCGSRASKVVTRHELKKELQSTRAQIDEATFGRLFSTAVVDHLGKKYGRVDFWSSNSPEKPIECVLVEWTASHGGPLCLWSISFFMATLLIVNIRRRHAERRLNAELRGLIETYSELVTHGPEKGYMKGPTAVDLLENVQSNFPWATEKIITRLCDNLGDPHIQKSMFSTSSLPFWFSRRVTPQATESAMSLLPTPRRIRGEAKMYDAVDPPKWPNVSGFC